jgi:hypothetical protein
MALYSRILAVMDAVELSLVFVPSVSRSLTAAGQATLGTQFSNRLHTYPRQPHGQDPSVEVVRKKLLSGFTVSLSA